jgi:hypothetical protein
LQPRQVMGRLQALWASSYSLSWPSVARLPGPSGRNRTRPNRLARLAALLLQRSVRRSWRRQPPIPPPAPDQAKIAAAQRIDTQAAEKRAEAAKHAAWLDAAKKTRAYEKTVAALKAAEPNSSEQWALQTRLNNMLADIKNHQQELARLTGLAEDIEKRAARYRAENGIP